MSRLARLGVEVRSLAAVILSGSEMIVGSGPTFLIVSQRLVGAFAPAGRWSRLRRDTAVRDAPDVGRSVTIETAGT